MISFGNPLFWRMPNTPISGADHVLSYLVIAICLTACYLTYRKLHKPALVVATDAIIMISLGTWLSDYLIYHSFFSYMYLALPVNPYNWTVMVIGVALRIMLFKSLGKRMLICFGLYVGMMAPFYAYWHFVLNDIVDFIGHDPTKYWTTSWVSEWEIGVWCCNCIIYYTVMVWLLNRKSV